MDAFFGMLILIGVFWVLLKLVGDTDISSKKKPPIGSGFVYVLERDGFVKIGKHEFVDEKGQVREDGLVGRLGKYISISEIPKDNNVNLIYYNYFESATDGENLLREHLDRIALQYEKSVLSKKKEGEEDIETLSLIKVPGRLDWYEYKCHFREIYHKIKDWFEIVEKLDHYNYAWIFEKTETDLKNEKRIFIHELPPIPQKAVQKIRVM